MIVPMLKIALLLPCEDRAVALTALQALGILHIETEEAAPDAGGSVAACAAELERVETVIRHISMTPEGQAGQPLEGEAALKAAEKEIEKQATARRRLEEVGDAIARLAPWGEVDPALLEALAARGLYCYPCVASEAAMEALREAGYVCEPLASSGKMRRFAVISDHPIPAAELPLAEISLERPLSALEAEREALTRQCAASEAALAGLRASLPELRRLQDFRQEALDLAQARAAMADHGVLTTLTGFIPEPSLEALRACAAEHGWGLCCRPADASLEPVPTLLQKPRWVRLVDPLMRFLSLLPGYDEYDVSLPVLVFFTIFFGMLMGDAVYGTLIFGVSLAVSLTAGRRHPELRRTMAMMTLLGASSLIWGACSGNYAGWEGPGIPWLASDPEKNKHVQLVCFLLALTHMSLAHALRIVCDRSWRNVLANLGWIAVLVSNFALIYRMLLYPGDLPGWMLYGYGFGVLAAAIGSLNLKDIGSVLGFPFDVISSFVDMLSYIRLFAVGLAGYYLANCFDGMALGMMHHSWYGAVGGTLVLLFGQLLNVALCALGVLVHGVRLNTLEFSNHLGLRWTGIEFHPLRKHASEPQQ